MRRTFRFDKLVRDLIPDDMRREGSDVTMRQLSDSEYLAALRDKLIEETAEISINHKADALKELADLQEVIDCLVEALRATKEEVAMIQATKRQKRGSFKDRQYIETITLEESLPMVRHYRANPERYPEIKSSGV